MWVTRASARGGAQQRTGPTGAAKGSIGVERRPLCVLGDSTMLLSKVTGNWTEEEQRKGPGRVSLAPMQCLPVQAVQP